MMWDGEAELPEIKKPVIKPLTKKFGFDKSKNNFLHEIYPETTRTMQEIM